LLQRFYDPHHRQLAQAAADQLAHGRHPQIVDCHSFPSRALPCDRDQRADRPDFCIGTDRFHTDADLVGKLRDCLESRGLTVGIDWPYSGALVPNCFYQCNVRVRAVMIEVNRGLYMNETTGEASDRFAATRDVVHSLLHLIDAHERDADTPPA
jgi:N-formylglutamate amidohydrolase